MKLRLIIVFAGFVLVAGGCAPTSSPAPPAGHLVVIQSAYAPGETLDRLEETLKAREITVFARIDHGAGAAAADMALAPAQVLIFGNPKLGTPLLQASPLAGLDLPMRVLAWEDAMGKSFLAYLAPAALADRYDIAGEAETVARMTAALEALTGTAVK